MFTQKKISILKYAILTAITTKMNKQPNRKLIHTQKINSHIYPSDNSINMIFRFHLILHIYNSSVSYKSFVYQRNKPTSHFILIIQHS